MLAFVEHRQVFVGTYIIFQSNLDKPSRFKDETEDMHYASDVPAVMTCCQKLSHTAASPVAIYVAGKL